MCICAVWIINWALQIHCNPRVPLGANKLVSRGWIKTDHRGLQKIYVSWYSFCVLSKSLAWSCELKQLLFLDTVPPKMKIISFLFETMKNDWVSWKVLERVKTILKFKNIFNEVLKLP